MDEFLGFWQFRERISTIHLKKWEKEGKPYTLLSEPIRRREGTLFFTKKEEIQ